MILIVCGPLRGDYEANVQRARDVAGELWAAGHYVLCPHANTYGVPRDGIPEETLMAGHLAMQALCQGTVMLPGWQHSQGAIREFINAARLEQLVFHWPQDRDKLLMATQPNHD